MASAPSPPRPSFDDHYLRQLEYDDLVSVVPFVRRLGYPVILFSNEDQGHPFNIACAAVQSSDFILIVKLY